MNQANTMELEREQLNITGKSGGLRRFFKTLGLGLVWAFLSALIVGSMAAAIWTVIPTELLAWGAGVMNRMGYISHCSYAPISTSIMLVVAIIGTGLAFRIPRGRYLGRIVFGGTSVGLVLGALIGIDIVMYIGMGIGLGVGLILGLLIELLSKTGRDMEGRV